jgi:hypothetical protein
MRNFLGHDGFIWWIGIVEDTSDPLTLGRCKVRCFGYHPAKSTNLVPTGDLPWATTIHPLNTPNLYGTPRLGDWVFGFFLDSLSAQEPAILGYLPAIPEAASSYFGTPSSLTRNFANVVNKNDVLWDVNNASIKISADTNLTLNGKSNLILSDSADTITLNALLSRISTIENQLDIVTTVNQLNTVALVPVSRYSDFWSKAFTFTPGQQFGVGGVKDRNWGLYRSWYGFNPDTTWGSSGTGATGDRSGTVSLKASGNGVDVVIVDGVIDSNHPEFAVNPDGTGGSRVKYFNWYSLNIPGDPNYGQTYSPPIVTDGVVDQDSNHAVHVAGIVAGNTQGWAPNANIYNISPAGLAESGGAQFQYVYEYILAWHNQKRSAGNMTPTIVNNSLSTHNLYKVSSVTSLTYRGVTYTGPFTSTQLKSYGIYIYTTIGSDEYFKIQYIDENIDADIQECINAGIIMVCAAGNDSAILTKDPSDIDYNNSFTNSFGSTIYYNRGGTPGSTPGVICVGAISSSIDSPGPDRKANFSNRGPRIDVFAPGTIITSAWLTPRRNANFPYVAADPDARDSRYYVAKNSGTSMASPQVCGVLACALEITPTMNQADALAYITQAAGINQISTSTGGASDVYDLMGAPNRYLAVPSNLKGGI